MRKFRFSSLLKLASMKRRVVDGADSQYGILGTRKVRKAMGYWKGLDDSASNIRLLRPDGKWLAWDDKKKGDKIEHGAREQVKECLLESLNSTNLLVLLGSGTSMAAKNTKDKLAPTMTDLWRCVREHVGKDDFDQRVANVLGKKKEKEMDIESLLSLCKMKVEFLAERGDTGEQGASENSSLDLPSFVQKAEQAILDRVDFVSEKTDLKIHREFLRRLARRSSAKPRVKLFTTNYDLCIEKAAEARNLVLIDGFSHSAVQRFDRDNFQHDIVRRLDSRASADYIDGIFHLYKLHGSLDWRRRKTDKVIIRSIEHSDDSDPVLIFPRASKYQEAFTPPYLDMFGTWQTALREPDTTLIVSGFGFADDHISEPIWSALESNLSIRLVLCDPCFVPESELKKKENNEQVHAIGKTSDKLKIFQNRILSLVKDRDSRITVLNGRFSDLVLAIPDIIGETDRQRLAARLEHIREQENVR